MLQCAPNLKYPMSLHMVTSFKISAHLQKGISHLSTKESGCYKLKGVMIIFCVE